MPRPRSTVKQARVQPVTAKSPTDIDREGGKRLRALREEAGMSQTALAERAGITFQQVQKYENGANRVSISRLIQFCEALDVPRWPFHGAPAQGGPAAAAPDRARYQAREGMG